MGAIKFVISEKKLFIHFPIKSYCGGHLAFPITTINVYFVKP
jgi:hypothetical protein